MKSPLAPALAALCAFAPAFAAEPCAVFSEGCPAFEAWRDADFDAARRLAAPLAKKPATRDAFHHHAALNAYMEGRYADAISAHDKIDRAYAGYAKLDRMAVEALKRIGAPLKAKDFLGRRGKAEKAEIERLELAATAPVSSTLRETTVVPFVSDAITPFLPGVMIEINGVPTLARIDTGGTFINMTRAVAERLGVATSACVSAQASLQQTKSCVGAAAKVRIGTAEIRNAPVVTAETLTPTALGADTAVVIGTNFFEQFLVTFDYAKARLVISPRGDERARKAHFQEAGRAQSDEPFYLWGDHFLLVRGRIGDRRAAFFFDTGLVAVDADGVQAALLMDKAGLASVGETRGEGAFHTLTKPLSFGPLTEPGARVYVVDAAPVPSLGGVRVDALLSHGLMKRTTWTLDFDKRRIWFHAAENQ
jgi:hypothetical protein